MFKNTDVIVLQETNWRENIYVKLAKGGKERSYAVAMIRDMAEG